MRQDRIGIFIIYIRLIGRPDSLQIRYQAGEDC